MLYQSRVELQNGRRRIGFRRSGPRKSARRVQSRRVLGSASRTKNAMFKPEVTVQRANTSSRADMMRLINEAATASQEGKTVKSEAGEDFENSVKVAVEKAARAEKLPTVEAKTEPVKEEEKEEEVAAPPAAAPPPLLEQLSALIPGSSKPLPDLKNEQSFHQVPRTRQSQLQMIQDAADRAKDQNWLDDLKLIVSPASWNIAGCCASKRGSAVLAGVP